MVERLMKKVCDEEGFMLQVHPGGDAMPQQ
jgi:hypothetical protein